MSDTFPKTLEECKTIIHFFANSTENAEYIRAIKIDNQIVGCIASFFDINIHYKNAEISYWLSAKYRGKGVMPHVLKIFTQSLLVLICIEYGQDRLNIIRPHKGYC